MNIIIIMSNFSPSLLKIKGFFVAYWLAPQPCIEGFSSVNTSGHSRFSDHYFSLNNMFYQLP